MPSKSPRLERLIVIFKEITNFYRILIAWLHLRIVHEKLARVRHCHTVAHESVPFFSQFTFAMLIDFQINISRHLLTLQQESE